MSGTLDPDAAGSYERAADYDGAPTWTRTDGDWILWYNQPGEGWILSETPRRTPEGEEPFWWADGTPPTPPETMEPGQYATGQATISIHTP